MAKKYCNVVTNRMSLCRSRILCKCNKCDTCICERCECGPVILGAPVKKTWWQKIKGWLF
jgi:hypothetical protein